MIQYKKCVLILLIFISTLLECYAQLPKNEFRAVWIATVNNIDWPSKPGASSEVQKMELISMLDNYQKLNFNAVLFQVRPACDAFYASTYEPWSAWLTGKQGVAPTPAWDPLEFMVAECHARNMELHAWFNPFRVKQKLTDTLANTNVAMKYPEWTVKYGNNLYLDPGIPAVREYINTIIADVVSRYDVDAIHFDDYFYPYPIPQTPFPDTASFKKYKGNYSEMLLNDWRRENVDLIISSLNKTIKTIKPHVKFGISPFGVWRNDDKDPKGSKTRASISNYDDLYADVVKWQREGLIDYLIPQIYWEFSHQTANFDTLLKWWDANAAQRHVYVGHALYKAADLNEKAWKNRNELPKQVIASRQQKNTYGSAFFRAKYIELNPNNFTDSLQRNYYRYPALQPTMPWIDSIAPPPPYALKRRGLIQKNTLAWETDSTTANYEKPHRYVVYKSFSKNKIDVKNPANIYAITENKSILISNNSKHRKKDAYFWVTSIDRMNNESKPIGPEKIKY